MTVQPGAMVYTQGFGSSPIDVQTPVISKVNPGVGDVNYPVGKRWINTVENDSWTLTSLTSFNGNVTANWESAGGATTSISEISADTGTAIPVASTITIAGTTGEITTTASGSTVTLSIPATATLNHVTASTLSVTGTSNLGTGAGSNTTISSGTGAILGIGSSSAITTVEGIFNLNSDLGNVNPTIIGNLAGTNTLTLNSAGILAINSSDFIQASAPLIRLTGSLYLSTKTVSADYSMVAGDFYVGVNTSGGPVTILLPPGALAGDTVIIGDIGGNVATNEIIINGNGVFINVPAGLSQSQLAIVIPYTVYLLIYNGTTWSVV